MDSLSFVIYSMYYRWIFLPRAQRGFEIQDFLCLGLQENMELQSRLRRMLLENNAKNLQLCPDYDKNN